MSLSAMHADDDLVFKSETIYRLKNAHKFKWRKWRFWLIKQNISVINQPAR